MWNMKTRKQALKFGQPTEFMIWTVTALGGVLGFGNGTEWMNETKL